MNLTPDVIAEIFKQSTFISALIAGFSFAFLAVILTNELKKKVDDGTAGFAIATTAGLVVCSLGWKFSVPRILAMAVNNPRVTFIQLPENYRLIHQTLSLTFIACFFFFLTSLGLNGWIRSRTLGIVSTVIAAFAAVLRFG